MPQRTPASAARPTQTRTRAAWSLKSARGASPFGWPPHTARNAAGQQARRRKRAAFMEKLRIIETNQIEPACVHGIIDSAKRNCGFDKSE